MSDNNTLNHPESEKELETLENGGQPVEEAPEKEEETVPAEVEEEAPATEEEPAS